MMMKMNAIFGVTFAVLVLMGIGTTCIAQAAFNAEYGPWLRVCMPMPYEGPWPEDRWLFRVYTGREPSADSRGGCSVGQYPARSAFRVKQTLCRPLPPTSGVEATGYLTNALQDLRVCPAGQFPMRYGSGKDLEGDFQGHVYCVPKDPATASEIWDWRYFDRPIKNPYHASYLARLLANGSFCPPEMVEQWTRYSGYAFDSDNW
jgi:hypothetical protein